MRTENTRKRRKKTTIHKAMSNQEDAKQKAKNTFGLQFGLQFVCKK